MLQGTAATGAALVGARVDAKCATGNGSDTTKSDGSYRIEIAGGVLPCSLSTTSTDAAPALHSAAAVNGARANLTPATELAMARLYGRAPADAHQGFDAGTAQRLTPAALQAAAGWVADMLAAGGIQAGSNLISGPLAVGDAHDQALDQLAAKLRDAGLTLATAEQAVLSDVAGSGGAPTPPAQTLLAGAAPNCPALRSGTYRLIFLMPGDNGGFATDTPTLDAPALTVKAPDGGTSQLTASGPCSYTLPNAGEMVVSPAGVFVLRQPQNGSFRAAIGFPEQTHTVAALAGNWNFIGMGNNDGSGSTFHPFSGQLTLGADGKATALQMCENLRDCAPETNLSQEFFTPNAQGGFDNHAGGRGFLYRAGNGAPMLANLDRDGSLVLATHVAARSLSPIGARSTSWNLTLPSSLGATMPVSTSDNTTVAQAADGKSFTRHAVINFNTGATRPETIQINQFLEGFIRRVPEAVLASDGSASNVGEWLALGLSGMGLTPVAVPGNQSLILSVTKPAAP